MLQYSIIFEILYMLDHKKIQNTLSWVKKGRQVSLHFAH